jgi:hypothetical protein
VPPLDLVTADVSDDLVAAHADRPMQPPYRQCDVEVAESAVESQGVLVVGVDEGAIDVEDRSVGHMLSSCAVDANCERDQ